MNRVSQIVFAALVMCGMNACMTTQKTPEQRQADSAMVDHVQAALSEDKMLYARHITVRADGGVVTLGGYVWTPEELVQAREVARSVPGVSKVVDRMEVDRGAVQDSSTTR
jgi:hyperosmotically inducible periplasmic protein